ncbi:hypothetical protein GYA37_00755 [candidate division WWE3 bacterium]|uniref:Uncharacterized protein n=1 Tax=candidate division WWE3 bacterium TaxID=2053526 RepID=A0A7X9HSI4_UNCKA|nr:hypothetical protein [candidate division WWE3 bacterium]
MPEEQITNSKQTSQEIPLQQEEDTILNSIPNTKSNVESVIDIEKKEMEIKKKKKRFKFILTVLIISILLLTLVPIVVNFYKRSYIKNKPIVQTIEEEDKKIKVEDIQVEKKIQHNSDSLSISLEYLDKAKLLESAEGDGQIKKLEIIYEKQPSSDTSASVTEDNLKEGYIFKVSTFITTQRELDEIVQVKKDAFTIKCPQTATLSDINETTIDGIEGRTFEVTNCGSDYKLTYIVKGTLNYEFAQVVKGDIGYKQVYKAETEDILSSLKFYLDKTDRGPLETFISTPYGFQFEHPKFSLECCEISNPASKNAEKIVVLGDTSTFIDKNNFDGIGIFVDKSYDEDFNTYMEVQKKTLVDDYIVVKGEAPKLEEKSLKVGDKNGLMLKGYSWRGEDLIYVNISPGSSRNIVLVISIKNMSGVSFEKKVDEILKSFKYVVSDQ